jgi:hypothetical protein
MNLSELVQLKLNIETSVTKAVEGFAEPPIPKGTLRGEG